VRFHERAAARLAVTAALCLALGACTTSPTSEATGPSSVTVSSAPASGSSIATPPLTINIKIANGKVDPNGKKIDASVGQEVILQVTSDMDDEIHAHTGGAGYELEVKANEPTTGAFTLPAPGSFEVESHHLEKIIVILNVR
jgi:methionine-rich copper-binding protein CopC